MKISYDWLKEYIDLKKSPEEIADILTKSGSEVKAIERIDSDYIMEIEITPNRSDCLSYIGIARELSALTGKKIKMPPLKVKGKKEPGKAPFVVDIKDEDLCPRYTARLIRDVRVGESPDWLKKKIILMGLRPVNNVVDITNYVLFELGQPMHAFDYDKIKDRIVIIRRAAGGEKIVSIDNVERPLEKNTLVIADKDRPIAIGGVMGGLNTEVTEKTKNILLESAYFNPTSIRRTSFKLTLMSESSYRFERGVDPRMVLSASDRAALLIADICGGTIGELVDKGKKLEKEKIALLRIKQLNKILNLKLKENYVKKSLSGLLLETSSPKKGIIKISVPSFRLDIKYEVDLIEEVGRIYGYEKIDTTIPKIISNPERKSISWRAREKAKDILTSLGLSEVITYGLLRRQDVDRVFGGFAETIVVKNPLSAEQEMMRPSLIPGILNVISYNMNRGIKDLKLFEMGNIYYRDSERLYREEIRLCIAMTGAFSNDWQRPKADVTFFDLKGILEILFRELELKDFSIAKKMFSFLREDSSSDILYGGKHIGEIGCLANDIQEAFDSKEKAFLAEINFDGLVASVNLEKRFTDIPKYPSVKRDISLVATGDVSFEEITSLVKEQGGELIENIELFDRYSGKQIQDGHQGLSFRIEYRDRKKTLTAEDVDKLHTKIRGYLIDKLGVALR